MFLPLYFFAVSKQFIPSTPIDKIPISIKGKNSLQSQAAGPGERDYNGPNFNTEDDDNGNDWDNHKFN